MPRSLLAIEKYKQALEFILATSVTLEKFQNINQISAIFKDIKQFARMYTDVQVCRMYTELLACGV